jgi:tRNA threonylcarbamoyladenosine biosynthesis protein TsaB
MILALKTDSNTAHLWLYESADSKEALAHDTWESGRDLADQLLGRILDFLHAHTAELTALRGVVIFSGPGSFTSLRIGHTVANALADSLSIPITSAQGDNWASLALGMQKDAAIHHLALPFYGTEAHVTPARSPLSEPKT